MRLKTILFLFIIFFGANVYAKDASISMIYTNALDKELPFAIFNKNGWSPAPNARFVKLHLYFDKPIMVRGLEIDSCNKPLSPRLSIFFNFDQWVLQLSPKLRGNIPEALYPRRAGNKLVLQNFRRAVEVRSLTINFEKNQNFKICDIKLLDEKLQPYSVKVTKVVPGSVTASSTLAPASAYAPIYLFDSRFEYAWASDKKASNVDLSFRFKSSQRIEKIRVWNGYQRSVTHCFANSRARTIQVTGSRGYSETIKLQDKLGSQVIRLPKPFYGKKLDFKIVNSYLGKSYKDLVISEIRFHDGKEWFSLSPLGALQSRIKENRAQFSRAKIKFILNDSYRAHKNLKVAPYWVSSKIRFRADGSFYQSGEVGEAGGYQYFALGNYEIKEYHPQKGLKLRLFGLYYETEVYGDCNGCGRDCNKSSAGKIQKIFQEHMWYKPVGNNRVRVRNINGGKRIKFNTLIFSREK